MISSKPEITECGMLDKNVYVVSDLHLAAGTDSIGNYFGTENFFADSLLCRFLDKVMKDLPAGKGVLIINGDFVDFLRIVNVPSAESDFQNWQAVLLNAGIDMSVVQLKQSVDNAHEKEFGLKTHDFKSVWKLLVCSLGHPEVFSRLSNWVKARNMLIIVKGNHDLEWYWPAVQNFFRFVVLGTADQAGSNDFVGPITFVDDVLLINGQIYLEHGHRYENITFAEGTPVLEGEEELRLSVGSFFNRYLLNRIEISYPYVDNIRPQSNVLPMLLKERFPLAIKVLLHYVPLAIRMIPKREKIHALRFAGQFLFIVFIPIAITAYAIFSSGRELHFHFDSVSGVLKPLLTLSKNLCFLASSYFFGRLLAFVKLAPPGSLSAHAEEIFRDLPGVRLVTFGHTHDPEQFEKEGKVYYNTGTWMPVYQLNAADIRLDLSYSFLFMKIDAHGLLISHKLSRWNDDAGRIEPVRLVQREKG